MIRMVADEFHTAGRSKIFWFLHMKIFFVFLSQRHETFTAVFLFSIDFQETLFEYVSNLKHYLPLSLVQVQFISLFTKTSLINSLYLIYGGRP